ncbi:MAG: hypothetical protein WC773_03220 [Patescibacteria group bacterium]
MSKRNILMICADTGGAEGIIPVYRQLAQDQRNTVRVVADGPATKLLIEGATSYLCLGPECCDKLGWMPDLVVTSLDSSGNIGFALVQHLRQNGYTGPVVALSDYPVSGALTNDEWPNARPDYITAGDEVGKQIILRAWPDFNPDRAVVTGYPAFDRLAGFEMDAVRCWVRQELGISPEWCLVSAFSSIEQTGEMMRNVVRVIMTCTFPVRAALRPHPRLAERAPEEFAAYQAAFASLGDMAVDTSDFTTDEVIAASDVVIAPYSTVLGRAAAMGVSAVNYALPHTDKMYEKDATIAPRFPWVEAGYVAEARTLADLRDMLNAPPRVGRGPAFDDNSALRAATFIDSLL